MAILLERREEKSRLKGGGIMIKIEINFKLKKISIIIKKDRSAGTGTVKSAK